MKIDTNIAASLTMSAIFFGFAAGSVGLGAEARLMPLLVGGTGLAICLVQLTKDIRGRPAEDKRAVNVGHYLPPLLWLIATAAVIVLFGFSIGTPLMTVIYCRFVQRVSLLRTLAWTVANVLVIEVGLNRLAGSHLFEGLLTPAVLRGLESVVQ